MDSDTKIVENSCPEHISRLIHATPFRFSDERALQQGIEDLFTRKGIPYEREFMLSKANRIDFLCGRVGVEVKVDSSASTVQRQLWRYAQDPRIDTLILVTNRSKHASIGHEILGKPLIMVYLIASIF